MTKTRRTCEIRENWLKIQLSRAIFRIGVTLPARISQGRKKLECADLQSKERLNAIYTMALKAPKNQISENVPAREAGVRRRNFDFFFQGFSSARVQLHIRKVTSLQLSRSGRDRKTARAADR